MLIRKRFTRTFQPMLRFIRMQLTEQKQLEKNLLKRDLSYIKMSAFFQQDCLYFIVNCCLAAIDKAILDEFCSHHSHFH